MARKRDNKLLEDNGWSVDCESPFEICHEDGSVATGQAAHMVVSYLRMNEDIDDEEEEEVEELDLDEDEF